MVHENEDYDYIMSMTSRDFTELLKLAQEDVLWFIKAQESDNVKLWPGIQTTSIVLRIQDCQRVIGNSNEARGCLIS